MARATPSRKLEDLVENLDAQSAPLSPEVEYYLTSRGYEIPKKRPLYRTREPRDVPGAMFDPARVDKVLKAVEALRHTKGKWAGKPLRMESIQVAYFIAPIFGWVHEDSSGDIVRIIRNVWIELPRKAAKTTMVSALSFYLAFADGEGGAEVLIGAASKDQARLAYAPLRELVLSSPALQRAGIKATKTTIEKAVSGSVLKAVSSRGDLAHGANIHGGLLDELHVHKTPDLLEAFETGTGARNQPIVFIITTADDGSTTSVYAQRREKIERIATGVLKSTSTYGVIFAVPKEADPFAEATWDMANPLYPVTPSPEFMKAQAEDARSSEVALASFLRLHLGIRSDRATRFFPMDRWTANAGLVDEAKLRGREAYGGIDLGSTSDLSALSWIFPDGKGGFDNVVRFWMPEEALPSLDARTMKMASTWVKQGYIRLTPGDVTDYEFIRRQIESDLEAFDVVQVGYDPWNAQQLVNELTASEAPMVKVIQGIRLMSPALKELDRLIRTGSEKDPVFRHGGNPVLRWNADNVRVREDANGNIAPDKKHSMDKIDGISATLTALSTFLSVENMVSAYEDHRMEVV